MSRAHWKVALKFGLWMGFALAFYSAVVFAACLAAGPVR